MSLTANDEMRKYKKSTVIYLALPSTGRDTEATTTISSYTRQQISKLAQVGRSLGMGEKKTSWGKKAELSLPGKQPRNCDMSSSASGADRDKEHMHVTDLEK